MTDSEFQSTIFFIYTTPNGEVKLEVVSILEITGSNLFPFWKQFAKKIQ
jgi:hypothetical protein